MFKGTLIYELLSLPNYWRKVWSIPTTELKIDKFKFGTQRRQYYLKIAGPTSDPKKVVIYLHGGGWLFGTPEGFVQNAMVFTRKDYTVYMPSYRRLPRYDFQDMYDDLKNVIEAIGHRNNRSIDKLIISGMSAGAHLGAILALDKEISWEKKLGSNSPMAFIGIGSPLDLKGMWQSPVLKLLTRKGYATANPIEYLNKQAPTILSISAGKDGIVNYKSQLSFEEHAKKIGLPIFTHHEPKFSHMEIAEWSIPETKIWIKVNDFLVKLNVDS